ncbi:Uncharacterized protein TCM_046029 [Theobroma cacao]|uniref:RNase H type-1 domain-containing protein n=1 Tax=Theobroma cacao TaxID=3641 RepID=S1RWD9_THECC|nr:Uncharacterized protein TCM_046029 [Theobroma cacao]
MSYLWKNIVKPLTSNDSLSCIVKNGIGFSPGMENKIKLWHDCWKKCDWGKPSTGFTKFNIDGAARGCPSPFGMGGAMHIHEKHVKILFSKPLGHGDSNMAEILAIKQAFYLFVAFSWDHDHINCLKNKIKNWSVIHTSRKANHLADSLAKLAVDRSTDHLQLFA